MVRFFRVKENSMLPLLKDGDIVLASDWYWLVGQLRPGDRVIFKHPLYGMLVKLVDELRPAEGMVTVRGTRPPAPAVDAVNASVGGDTAAIAVTWDKASENGKVANGAGQSWYEGAASLQGYRIFRSSDFQFSGSGKPDAFRAAWWDTVATIPVAALPQYWDASLNRYRFVDRSVQFGFRYGYYVSAFWTPTTWTAPNGTVVPNPGLIESGPVNKTLPTRAAPGPVNSMDVFVAPNPFVFNDPDRSFVRNGNLYGLEFRNLPKACTIRIYTVMGDLVKTIEHKVDERGNRFGSEPWDQKSDSGLLVAPGLYVYHVESSTPGVSGKLTGKLMIIR